MGPEYDLLMDAYDAATLDYPAKRRLKSYFKTKLRNVTGFPGVTGVAAAGAGGAAGKVLAAGAAVAEKAINLKVLGYIVPVLAIPLELVGKVKEEVLKKIQAKLLEKRRAELQKTGPQTLAVMGEVATLEKIKIEDTIAKVIDAINKLEAARKDVAKTIGVTATCGSYYKAAKAAYYYAHRVDRLKIHLAILQVWTEEVQGIIDAHDNEFNALDKTLGENVTQYFKSSTEFWHEKHCNHNECYFSK